MSLLTESPHPYSVSLEDGCADCRIPIGVAVLDSDVCRDMRWCAQREEYQEFREFLEGGCGRVGVCLGCGEERIIFFSRVPGALFW